MCIYAYMYVCMHACIHVCMCAPTGLQKCRLRLPLSVFQGTLPSCSESSLTGLRLGRRLDHIVQHELLCKKGHSY